MNAYDASGAGDGQAANGWPGNGNGHGERPLPRAAAPAPHGASSGGAAWGGAAARAGVGRATVGRAVVAAPPAPAGPNAKVNANGANGHGANGRGAGGEGNGADSGGWSGVAIGRRPAGRAAVGAASVGAASPGAPPAAGRATAGRAVVRPVSPAPGQVGPGGPGAPGGPYGPGGPGGPGRGRAAGGRPKRSKRRRTINWLIASFALLVMAAGTALVGATYYSTTVVLPSQMELPLASTIYFSDGKKALAKLGEVDRTFVTIKQIPDHVQKAVASAEDRKFYEHDGVDYAGIVRAGWNNLTGGERQGASTITQQYARNAFANLQGVTYARKVREAVLASKLNDKYSKNQIMEFYLNTIYFGRGAYGIEAAAQRYFGHSVDKLTVAEGAVLAAVIKQPVASATHKGFDPAVNPPEAKARWEYVLNGMVEKGWLPADQKPAAYPKVNPPPKDGTCFTDCGVNKPTGNVINYVRDEMVAMGLCQPETCSKQLKDGGYKITTSINSAMQTDMERTIQRSAKGSELSDQPKNLMAAGVAIEPATGRVKAYYGGDNGTGHDYAGKNWEDGTWQGGHAPGSSFKIYTLAAALDNNISLESHWDARPFTVPGTKIHIQNAGRNPSCAGYCTLRQSTLSSYNVPFYHITEQIGADKVVDMARAAGVQTLWSNNPVKPYDLTKQTGKQVAPNPFFNIVGYGAYPITVIDHANGLATITNRGVYNKAHFVLAVQKKDEDTGKWKIVGGEQLKGRQTIRPEVADDVNDVLQKISGGLNGGRPATGKTGTWELNEKSSDNAHAWMIGATPQLATAVWVGNVGAEKAIRDKNGNKIQGSSLPKDIWKRFMNEALDGAEIVGFPAGKGIGDPDAGNGKSPSPAAQNCKPTDLMCLLGGGNRGGGGPGGGGGGGGGGGVILPPAIIEPPAN
ncbi:MAG TPA: transglycosylase domain-containing protein [Asanoa sp.]